MSRAHLRLLAVLALTAVLAGCRLDVTADGRLEPDGSGVVSVVLEADEAMLAELDALGVDPTAEVVAAAAGAAPWTVERTASGDRLTVELSRPVGDPQELADAFRALASGLTPHDPAILVDLDVSMDTDGSVAVAGEAGFRPPSSVGVELDGEPVGPDRDVLAGVTEDAVSARLVLRLPGSIAAHDGDEVSGRRVTWNLPVDGMRAVSATSTTPTALDAVADWMWAAGAGVVVLIALGALVLWRRRRSRSGVQEDAGASDGDPADGDPSDETS